MHYLNDIWALLNDFNSEFYSFSIAIGLFWKKNISATAAREQANPAHFESIRMNKKGRREVILHPPNVSTTYINKS